MAVLATPEDLLNRYDRRTVGQLLVDDDGVVLEEDEILENPKLLAILSAAGGRVRAALLAGARYRPEDLDLVAGDDREFLVDLVCMIAMARLFGRRPGIHFEQSQALVNQAEVHLKDLRQGVNLFNLSEYVAVANPTVNGPTTVEYQTLNLMTDQAMGRHYPSRPDFLPTDRG